MADDSRYDAFLGHSSKDKPVVRALAERLRADGLRVWFDEDVGGTEGTAAILFGTVHAQRGAGWH